MGRERRQFDRVDLGLAVQYRRTDLPVATWQPGNLQDLSAGGMRVFAPEPLPVGERLEVQVRLPVRPVPILMAGQIMWEKPVQGGNEYGVMFEQATIDRQSELDELVQFLRAKPS